MGKELSKGFTGIEINGVRFSNIKEMLIYMNKQRDHIIDLEKENAELKELFADCDTCKRTCDIGNCCESGSDYLPDVEKVLNNQKKLTEAKEIMNIAIKGIKYWGIVGGTERPFEKQAEKLFNLFLDKAEQFLKNDGCPDVMCEDCTKEDCGIKQLGLVGKVK